MKINTSGPNRRVFLASAAAAAATVPGIGLAAPQAARYRRYNVTSPEGQRMLVSYAKGVEAMLKLPADHPQNWFRNAFVHLLDCPHGNWWFYMWHRGYIGYFEQTIRTLSGNPDFALPYWDWTQLPEIPARMFNGVLTPTDGAYEPYTGNLARFSSFIKPTMIDYWGKLSPAQRAQLDTRGYKSFDDMWNDVTGYSPSADAGISGNSAFAITCGARYLSRDNPKLDEKTTYDVSPFVILSGLLPTDFYNADVNSSFSSSKTPSHNTPPSGATKFSMLEGLPHNKVHNCIGGVGPLDPGPYGSMTNFLSPVDPIFFLHHANLDRLWDVWVRKQQGLNLPILPSGDELATLCEEPFLFYVNGDGRYVGPAKAGDYLDTKVFGYDYEPGFGEAAIKPPVRALRNAAPARSFKATINGNAGSVSLPRALLQDQLGASPVQPLLAEVTIPRPSGLSTLREFDVLVNAPAGIDHVEPGSPYYAGTIAFFGANMGAMPGMDMSKDATFTVPLPRSPGLVAALGAAPNATINIRVTPSRDHREPAPVVKSLLIRTR